MNPTERLQTRINYVFSLLLPTLPPRSTDQIRRRVIYEHGVFFWYNLIQRESRRPKDALDLSVNR